MVETASVPNVYRRIAALALNKDDSVVTAADESLAQTVVSQTMYADDPNIDVLLRHFNNVPQKNIEEIQDLFYCILRKDITEVGPRFKHGTYKHFKGGRYVTLLRAQETETSAWSLVYMSLFDGITWVRPETDFSALVRWPDGKYRSRFMKLPEVCQKL